MKRNSLTAASVTVTICFIDANRKYKGNLFALFLDVFACKGQTLIYF